MSNVNNNNNSNWRPLQIPDPQPSQNLRGTTRIAGTPHSQATGAPSRAADVIGPLRGSQADYNTNLGRLFGSASGSLPTRAAPMEQPRESLDFETWCDSILNDPQPPAQTADQAKAKNQSRDGSNLASTASTTTPADRHIRRPLQPDGEQSPAERIHEHGGAEFPAADPIGVPGNGSVPWAGDDPPIPEPIPLLPLPKATTPNKAALQAELKYLELVADLEAGAYMARAHLRHPDLAPQLLKSYADPMRQEEAYAPAITDPQSPAERIHEHGGAKFPAADPIGVPGNGSVPWAGDDPPIPEPIPFLAQPTPTTPSKASIKPLKSRKARELASGIRDIYTDDPSEIPAFRNLSDESKQTIRDKLVALREGQKYKGPLGAADFVAMQFIYRNYHTTTIKLGLVFGKSDGTIRKYLKE